jgi:hypothetical protein
MLTNSILASRSFDTSFERSIAQAATQMLSGLTEAIPAGLAPRAQRQGASERRLAPAIDSCCQDAALSLCLADGGEPRNKLCLWADGTLNISHSGHIMLCRKQAMTLAFALVSWAAGQA